MNQKHPGAYTAPGCEVRLLGHKGFYDIPGSASIISGHRSDFILIAGDRPPQVFIDEHELSIPDNCM